MCRVAVIDDDPGFIDLACELLEDRGWNVVPCVEAELAVTCVEQAHPDVVLLDVRMDRGYSGWDILDALRTTPATSAIPIIVCSAASDELRTHETWLDEQRVTVLSKPFDIDELYERVEVALASTADRGAER